VKTINDTLGDALTAFRKKELDDVVVQDGIIVLQLNGLEFDRLYHEQYSIDGDATLGNSRPHVDLSLAGTAGELVHRFKAVVAYAGMSSISLVLEPSPKNGVPPSYFELAMEVASVAGFHYGARLAIMARLTLDDKLMVPVRFQGDVFTFPDRELASRFVEWRQILNHREVTRTLGRRFGVHNDITMKPLAQRRAILEAKGADFEGPLGDTLQGQLVRRQIITRPLTDEEIARMPKKSNKSSQVSRAAYLPDARIPNLSLVGNLSSVLFEGAEPEINDLPLARAVAC